MASFNLGKIVSFNNVVKVYHYRQTPIKPDVSWLEIAADRARFERRVLEIEAKIGYVFAVEHRKWIYSVINS